MITKEESLWFEKLLDLPKDFGILDWESTYAFHGQCSGRATEKIFITNLTLDRIMTEGMQGIELVHGNILGTGGLQLKTLEREPSVEYGTKAMEGQAVPAPSAKLRYGFIILWTVLNLLTMALSVAVVSSFLDGNNAAGFVILGPALAGAVGIVFLQIRIMSQLKMGKERATWRTALNAG